MGGPNRGRRGKRGLVGGVEGGSPELGKALCRDHRSRPAKGTQGRGGGEKENVFQ